MYNSESYKFAFMTDLYHMIQRLKYIAYFKYNRYTDSRKLFYLEVENRSPGFKNVTDQDKLNVIMCDSIIRCTMKYLQDIWNLRTELLYENVKLIKL